MSTHPTIPATKVFSNSLRGQRILSVFGFALAVTLAAFSPSAEAQIYSVFYTFPTAQDGNRPQGVIEDQAGNLYGATYYGGANGVGAIFKLDAAGNETVLHSFKGPDGNAPLGVVRDAAGNIYGATAFGGVGCSGDFGCGTVFKLDTNGKETVLHRFGRHGDGRFPGSGLVRDAAGNLYGTTYNGGVLTCDSSGRGCGTIFKIDASGNETVLHRFTGKSDGSGPNGLTLDEAGDLYGTTPAGTVFKVDPSGRFSVLYRFTGGADGESPYAGVIRDAEGNLYGTTLFGGDFGFGTVYKVDSSGKETVLYSFTGGADGSLPYAGVVRDKEGNLYGTAAFGGEANCVGSDNGCGVAFKLDAAGHQTILHTFTSLKDGAWPYWGVTLDKKGDLFGATATGGDCCGTIFKFVP